MARYQIQTIKIAKIAKGTNQGKDYMVIEMLNTLAPLEGIIKYTEFTETLIDMYRPYVATANGGTAESNKLSELPDMLKYISGHFVTWQPPKECIPFNKIYVTSGTHTVNGTSVQHQNGDVIVDKWGKPRLYESVVVFCKYYMTPDFPGVPQYYKGNNPVDTGQKYFDAFCKSIHDSSSQSVTSSDPNEEEGAISTEAPKNIVGYDPKTGQPIYG